MSSQNEQDIEKDISKNKPFVPLYYALVLACGIIIGYFFTFNSNFTSSSASLEDKNSNNKINNLIEYINEQYVDTINRKQLENKTITSMLKSLDPHSDFIPAEELTAVNEPLEGNFDGIGVEFSKFRIPEV